MALLTWVQSHVPALVAALVALWAATKLGPFLLAKIPANGLGGWFSPVKPDPRSLAVEQVKGLRDYFANPTQAPGEDNRVPDAEALAALKILWNRLL